MNNLQRIRAVLYILSWKAVLDGRAYPWTVDCKQGKWGRRCHSKSPHLAS